mgnify:CR=1 FL=1
MIDETITITLKQSQVQFLLDMMMGCPLGHTRQCSYTHNVDDAEIYDQLKNCLPHDQLSS